MKMPSIFLVQLVIAKDGKPVRVPSKDVVHTRVFNVRALNANQAIEKAIEFEQNKNYAFFSVDERDSRYVLPEDMNADVEHVQFGYLNPNLLPQLDREYMQRRADSNLLRRNNTKA
jgi:hypothetical protein